MTSSRREQVNLEATPYYHCMTRCVRRSFLCGVDSYSKQDYSHRKTWMLARLKKLASIFSIKVCAYALMSNHYHLVLRVDEGPASDWSNEEVVRRWSLIYPRDAKLNANKKLKVIEWRRRLYDISWFMRCLNEPFARAANKEDNCKGRFWESRFKSQALLDEGAVLSAMVYVDLNPIRAGIVDTPEESDFTSIFERIKNFKHQQKTKKNSSEKQTIDNVKQVEHLLALNSNNHNVVDANIHIPLLDYFDLVDYTGRVIRADKSGAIPSHLEPILSRLDFDNAGWLSIVQNIGTRFSHAIGSEFHLSHFSQMQNRKRMMKGIKAAKQSYLVA
tara:strand:- start:11689 stop:12681 length:993 start_codon:yes stop_codon:yes gene_type:complete